MKSGIRVVIIVLTLLVIPFLFPVKAASDLGTIKPGTPFEPDPSGNGRAVAYDGVTTLYYTIFPDENIYKTTTAGVSLGPIPNPPGSGRVQCGALSWDATQQTDVTGPVLWCGSYDASGDVYTVDPVTGIATRRFTHTFTDLAGNLLLNSCYSPGDDRRLDGLAYDASDNKLWLSGDAAKTVFHTETDGTVLGAFTVPDHPSSGGTGCNTGIEVAPGGFLELAMQINGDVGPHVIVKIEKADDVDNPPIIVSFTALNTGIPGIEDISYDANTFAPRCALWTNQFGIPNLLTAFDVQCTRTIGYWKNHPAADFDGTSFLPITLGDDDTNGVCFSVDTDQDVTDILKGHKGQDVGPKLEAQLLAAKLNVAMGDIPQADLDAIALVIDDADALLNKNGCDPDTGKKGADRAEGQTLHELLDAFNNKYSP